MALQKQAVSISLSQGIDTKTDQRQVVPGKLEVLQNSRFVSGMELNKRNGYTLDATISTSIGRSTYGYKDQLVAYDNNTLYGYVPESGTAISKGFSQPVDLSSTYIYSPNSGTLLGGINGDAPVSMAVHSSGYAIYVFNNSKYIITSRESGGQVVVQESTIGTSVTTKPRVFALGNYFIIYYYFPSTTRMRYISIPISTLVANSSVDLFTNCSGYGEAAVYGSKLYMAADHAGTAEMQVRSLDTSLTLSSTTQVAGAINVESVAVWIDSVPTTPNMWVAWHESSSGSNKLRYFVVDTSTFATVQASTDLVTAASIGNISGITASSAGHVSVIYYETQATYSYSSVNTNTLSSITATDTGTVGAGAVIARSVSLLSRVFQVNSNPNYNYFLATYGPENGDNLEPTSFLYSQQVASSGAIVNSAHNSPNAVAKIAAGAMQPYSTLAHRGNAFIVTQPAAISTTEVVFAIAKTQIVQTQNGAVSSSYAINEIDVNFNNNDAYQFQTLGEDMQTSGGFVWMYDGVAPCELNFHLFPEDLGYSNDDTAGGQAKAEYSYVALYRWLDGQGNIHRSAPSVPFAVDISGSATSTNTVTVKVPTIRVTEKPSSSTGPVFVDIYRNTPTGPGGNATDIYYKVNSAGNSVITTTDSVSITDGFSDASIIGNELLYTTGGVLENSGGPPSIGITTFKSRLVVIDAENRDQLWYSKQTVLNTPVEMNADSTLFIDPRFGPMTAIAVMDDKLIIFKENALFYITGDGPDATGANNDFSDATFIASNAGCVDPRSVVVTQDGLMFKSNKGIYLLDRGLGVTYIGAPVESYNSSHITGAILVPNSTQVQFTLDDGASCLMYDYFYKQWSVYLNHNAVAATVYNDLFTYLDPTGHLYTEAVGTYSDNGTAIYQSLTTSWLSLAQLQGFQRLYSLYLLTEYLSPHYLTISIAYDYDDTVVQTITVSATQLAAQLANDVGQWRLNFDRQKCQAVRFTITEAVDPDNTTPGAGLNLEAISLLVGAKLSYPKVPAIQEATS